MNYRTVGGTDIRLSEICFGMASLTEHRRQADTPAARVAEAGAAIRQALDLGITTFHYGPGYESGFVMRELLRAGVRRDRLQLIAKLASPTFQETIFSPATVTATVDRMLTETGFEVISVGQYIFQGRGIAESDKPRLYAGQMEADVAGCFDELRRRGKVLAHAGFAYSADFGAVVAKSPGMRGVVGFFNMMEHHLYSILPALRASGRSLFPMRPFCGGILTQKRPSWDALPEGDRLKRPAMRAPFAQREELGRLFADVAEPFETLALRYVLSFPETATCIVGLDSPEQVRRVVAQASCAARLDDRAAQVHALYLKQDAASRHAAFHTTKGWQE